MPLNFAESSYEAIQIMSDQPDLVDYSMCLDRYFHLDWCDSSLSDHLLHIFPSDESILEVMSLHERPREYYHHRSSLLPNSLLTQNPQFLRLVDVNCTPEEITNYTTLFKEICNVLSWSYN